MSFAPEELGTAGMRHTFDMLARWAHWSAAASLRIETDDGAVRASLFERLTIPLSEGPAGMAIYPFSLEQVEAHFATPIVAGCFRNTLSYRRLIHPRMPAYRLTGLKGLLKRQGYSLEKLVGVYPPSFVAWWFLSLLAGPRFPDLHFQWEQFAMNHLSTARQPGILFSHVVLFYARRLG